MTKEEKVETKPKKAEKVEKIYYIPDKEVSVKATSAKEASKINK